MFKKFLFFLFAFGLLLTASNAQTVIAKYAGEWLSLGVGGRALGMGGAHVAVANDVTSGYWNPAGLAHINYPQISLMHEEHFGNLVNYNYAAVGIPFGKDMSFSVSAIRVAVDGIPDTRNALYDANGDGILDINTDRLDYSKITEFSNTDYAFFLTFAKRATEKFYWGANVKLIKRDIAEESAFGIGFDAGAVYMPIEDLYLAANIMDVTTTLVAWSTGRNELISPTAKIGAAYGWHILGGTITPAVDFDVRFENRQFASNFNLGGVSFDFRGGLEYTYNGLFSVRGGYTDVQQFTIGAGIKLPKLNIDYSFARFNEDELTRFDDTHRISLVLTLEETRFLRDGQ